MREIDRRILLTYGYNFYGKGSYNGSRDNCISGSFSSYLHCDDSFNLFIVHNNRDYSNCLMTMDKNRAFIAVFNGTNS